MFKKTKQFSKKAVIIFVFLSQIFFGFFYANPVKAQLITSDLHWTVEDKIEQSIWGSVVQAVLSGVSYYANKFAYDSALYLSSSAKGQKPVIYQDGFGSYLKKTLEESVMTAVGDLSLNYGVNFCKPDAKIQVFLHFGIQDLLFPGIAPPTPPACTFQEFKGNWSNAYYQTKNQLSGILDAPPIEVAFLESSNLADSDFGIAFGAINLVRNQVSQDVEGAKNQRLEGQGIKPLTSPITDTIVTPWQTYAEAIKGVAPLAIEQNGIDGALWALGTGSTAAVISASGVFLNNLSSQLLEIAFTTGFFPDKNKGSTTAGDSASFGSAGLGDYRRAAESAFSFFFTSVPTKQLNAYNIEIVFAACPENPGLNNCVIDSGLQKALQIAKQGTPLTIQEAVKQGMLDPNKPFISPKRLLDHNDVRTCYLKGYCYSNLQKLRKVSVLPLGFELAALRSDPDNLRDWTLGKVMAGFEDCTRDGEGVAIFDVAKPFCHLIDPNWVLKIPETRCESLVNGPELLRSDISNRKEECVDVSTCVSEGENGECLGDFGYCTQQNNVWRVDGKTCPAEYATCTNYMAQGGKISSYLSRTVDYNECNADSVGCRAYSTEQLGSTWVSSASASSTIKKLGRNQTIYFGSEINTTACPESANGCSAFYTLNADFTAKDRLTYLKKAPDYLSCYDTNPSTPEINWPTTKADLSLLTNDAKCDAYAEVCLLSEVDCDSYTPLAGGPTVPGVIGNNYCASECVGYDTFRQEATAFAPIDYPLYFIPTDGDQCSAQYVGCDEFTNIEASSAGGETLEYYSDFKQCEKPDEGNDKVFYSWEGSVTEGFVLKVHHLSAINSARRLYIEDLGMDQEVEDSLSIGSPAYNDDTENALHKNYDICNENNYNTLINDPFSIYAANEDCRAFYDDAGSVFYRIFADTITVSNACHSIRKTESNLLEDNNLDQNSCDLKGGFWNGSSCEVCFNGGKYENGACIYKTISSPSESNSCPVSANGCRAYVGNAGNNIREIMYDSFEPFGTTSDALLSAREGWNGTNLSVVGEATQVGLHSLQVNTDVLTRTFDAGIITSGAFYELSFWSRGTPQNLRIIMKGQSGSSAEFTFNPITNSQSLLTVGDSWKEYKLGPVEFLGDDSGIVSIEFTRSKIGNSALGPYFIDNARLTKVNDFTYLVKDSWQTAEGYEVPFSCDNTPQDSLPGMALGCSAYNDGVGTTQYATGFENLCRAEAVGCEPLIDTFNTTEGQDSELAQIFNAWCAAVVGECKIEYTIVVDQGAGLQTSRNITLGSCAVEPGKDGCYIPKITIPAGVGIANFNSNIVETTVIIPADTPIGSPVYLTNSPKYQCSSQRLGCYEVALESHILPTNQPQAFEFSSQFILNNPNNYQETLCKSDQVGCGEFKSDKNTSYFVDPKITGGSVCTYKNAGAVGGDTYGWFLDGLGSCADNSGNLCRVDSDCGNGIVTSTCQNVGTTACYEGYVKQGGELGIWSNESTNYNGFVGACEQQYNSCTEFLDPADKSKENPAGKPYYVIFDEAMEKQKSECSGQVSQNEGCVLFDKTDNPNKLYNSAETYKNSEKADVKYGPVNPVETGNKDSNTILKVNRDRECSEWLACKTSVPFTDAKGVRTELCYQYDLCNESLPGVGCTSWVGSDGKVSSVLSQEKYVTRNTSWYDNEYTGYSLLGSYPVQDYIYVDFDLSTSADAELKKEFGDSLFLGYEFVPPLTFELFGCTNNGNGVAKQDFDRCGFDNGGICLNGKQCIYPIDGTFAANVNDTNKRAALETLDSGICKSFPEVSSPFAFETVVNSYKTLLTNNVQGKRIQIKEKNNVFNGANVCQEGECSCEYKKVSYGSSVVDYWPLKTSDQDIAGGVCVNGNLDGRPCESDLNCRLVVNGEVTTVGSCIQRTTTERRIGLRGFCLEYDLSRPIGGGNYACLTWLPIDTSASKIDLYNQFREAGYYPVPEYDAPNGGGEVYCTQSTSRGAGEYDTEKASSFLLDKRISDQKDINTIYIGDKSWIRDIIFNRIFYTGDNASGKADIRTKLDVPIYYYFAGDSTPAGQSDFYSLMQLWAWKFIDTNARLLRLELGLGKNNVGLVKIGGNKYNQTYLAPHIAQDSGTALHPPRDWSINLNPANSVYHNEYMYVEKDTYENRNIFTDSLSSAPIAELVNEVYVSPIQKDLVEDEFDKVYFVGLSHPNGEKGVTPDLLSTDFSLNLKELQQRLEDNKSNNDFIFADTIPQQLDYDYGAGYEYRTMQIKDKLAATWSYVLQRDTNSVECNGLFSFCNYTDKYVWTNDNVLLEERQELRNQIYRRYVITYFGNTTDYLPYFINKNGSPLNSSQDPFSADCTVGGQSKNNWLAIGMDFNKDGEFLGYISRWCHPASSGGGIRLAIIATLNDYCTELTPVYNPDEETTNKAWTNRVWKNAKDAWINWSTTPTVDEGGELLFTANNQPFGSLNLSKSLINSTTKKYVFNSTDKGISYFCDSVIFRTYFSIQNFACSALEKIGFEPNIIKMLNANTLDIVHSSTSFMMHFDILQHLFAQVYDHSPILDRSEELFKSTESDLGLSNNTIKSFTPPQVYSLNPAKCFNENGKNSFACTAGEKNSMTVNGKNGTLTDYNEDGFPDEDKDKNGEVDSIIAVGNKSVDLNFFAWANPNTMPIRRVMVDWSDDSLITNENSTGFYKNRKPFCGGETGNIGYCTIHGADHYLIGYTGLSCKQDSDCKTVGTDLVCLNDLNRFDNATRACEEGYFEFGHSYTCGPEDAGKDYYKYVSGFKTPYISEAEQPVPNFTTAQKDELSKFGVGLNEFVCVFQPKVQVLDNWGWCNGGVNNEGFYGETSADECGSTSNEAWTTYNNKIIIVPPKK